MDPWSIVAIVISGAALLFSVIGPIITAVVKNKHDTVMYERRFYDEHKHEVIERYLQCAGKYVFSAGYDDMKEFGEASAQIFMYAPEDLWEQIRQLNQVVAELAGMSDYGLKKAKKTQAQALYLALCEQFSVLRRDAKSSK